MRIDTQLGVDPKLRRSLALRDQAAQGDITMSISPATVAPAPTTSAWTRTVTISFVNAAGEVHDWINETYANTLSIADAGGGTASIASTTLTIRNGKAVVVVSGTAATWANSETDTLTVGNVVIAGNTVTGGTSVETFTTP